MTDHPIRPAFWNVPLWGEIGVYVLGFTAVALLIAGILRNRRLWLRGAEDPHPVKDRRARLFSVIADVFTQKKIRETSAGRLHAVLAWGFFLLFCGTALATLDWDVGHYVFDAQFLQGGFYLAYKFVLDCAGIAVLIALALGAARRWSKESGLPGDARFVCAYLSLAFIRPSGISLPRCSSPAVCRRRNYVCFTPGSGRFTASHPLPSLQPLRLLITRTSTAHPQGSSPVRKSPQASFARSTTLRSRKRSASPASVSSRPASERPSTPARNAAVARPPVLRSAQVLHNLRRLLTRLPCRHQSPRNHRQHAPPSGARSRRLP